MTRYVECLRYELHTEVQTQRWRLRSDDPRLLSFVAGIVVGRRRARRFWRRVFAALRRPVR